MLHFVQGGLTNQRFENVNFVHKNCPLVLLEHFWTTSQIPWPCMDVLGWILCRNVWGFSTDFGWSRILDLENLWIKLSHQGSLMSHVWAPALSKVVCSVDVNTGRVRFKDSHKVLKFMNIASSLKTNAQFTLYRIIMNYRCFRSLLFSSFKKGHIER